MLQSPHEPGDPSAIYPVRFHIQIVQGYFTLETVEAILNAANSHLMHGGDVAGVISKKGRLQPYRYQTKNLDALLHANIHKEPPNPTNPKTAE